MPSLASDPRIFPFHSSPLARPLAFALLLLSEVLLASLIFDTKDLAGKGALLHLAGDWAPPAIRFVIAMAGLAAAFSFPQWKRLSGEFESQLRSQPVAWGWFWVHLAAASTAFPLTAVLFWTKLHPAVLLAVLAGVTASGFLMVLAAARALLPGNLIRTALRAGGAGWALAAAMAGAAQFSGTLAQYFWRPSADLTFRIVNALLGPFLPRIVSDAETLTIGSERFTVNIAPACSGYEGVGLMLAFGGGWLWFFRNEYRFPISLLVLPVAAGLMWLLNCVRIAALILIGHSGAEQVALGGFHSQAGWIAFIGVALGMCIVSLRVPALAAAPRSKLTAGSAGKNDAAPYLMPFLAILAASIVSKAFSGGFEWLYPLRLVAAAAALLYYRKEYGSIGWRPGTAAFAAGLAVFLLWIGLDRSAPVSISPELGAMPLWSRSAWIAMRIFGAVVTVPIAEELAFRGFLLRRLVKDDFLSVSLREFPLIPVALSSLAFGALHGSRWIEGTLAGAIYAWVSSRHGRLGDAVAAHAATNALLAGWVLATGAWQYW